MSGELEWIDVKVARHWREAVDVVGLELVAFDARPLPAFEAGAYVDVLTPGGHLRPCSLCNAPAERHRYVIAVAAFVATARPAARLHVESLAAAPDLRHR